jgi:hypothetical protein
MKNDKIFTLLIFVLLQFAAFPAKAQCNDVIVNVVTAPATCITNGVITVTLSGSDASDIRLSDAEYMIQSTGDGFSNTWSNWPGGVFNEAPPGNYTVSMRAFCIQNEVFVTRGSAVVTVGGNYQPLESYSSMRRITLNCRPSGQITVGLAAGRPPYLVQIVDKPSDYTGRTTFGNLTGDLILDSLPAGTYRFAVEDACNYQDTSTTIVTAAAQDIPAGTIISGFNGSGASGCRNVTFSALGLASNHELTPFWVNNRNQFYEVAYYLNNTGSPLAVQNIGATFTLPATYREMRESGDFIQAVIQVRGGTSCMESSWRMNMDLPIFSSSVVDASCDSVTFNFQTTTSTSISGQLTTGHPVCLPYNWSVASTAEPGVILASGVASSTTIQYPAQRFSRGTSYILTGLDTDGTQFSSTITPSTIQGQEFVIVYQWNSLNGYPCEGSNFRKNYIYMYTSPITSNNRFRPGTIIKYIYGNTDTNFGGPGSEYIIPEGYNSNYFYPFSTTSYTTSQFVDIAPGRYVFEITNLCGRVTTHTITQGPLLDVSDFGFNVERVCNGLQVTPHGNITHTDSLGNVTNAATTYAIVSGPSGVIFSTAHVPIGGNLLLPTPGTYRIGIFSSAGLSINCAAQTLEVVFPSEGLTLDPSVTSSYVCKGEVTGVIRVAAINGVPPYTYELLGSGLPPNQTGFFEYGVAGQTYTIRVMDACASASFTLPVTMLDLNVAAITFAPNDGVFCQADTIQINCITLGNTTYSWTGPGGFTSNVQRPRIPAATLAMGGEYTVTVTPENCGDPMIQSITVTVLPQPSLPAVADPELRYCQNDVAPSLVSASGAVADSDCTLRWYTTSVSTTPITPPSLINTATPGTTTFHVAQVRTATGCESERVAVSVTITAGGTLGNNYIISGLQSICFDSIPAILIGSEPTGGIPDSYTFQWQSSPDGMTWTNMDGRIFQNNTLPALKQTTLYRRWAFSGDCYVSTVSDTVTVTVFDSLQAGSITGTQSICSNTLPVLLSNVTDASGGSGAISYQWEQSTDGGIVWNNVPSGGNGASFSPGVLTATTMYRRQAIDANCGAVHTTSVTVTVALQSTASMITAQGINICPGNDAIMVAVAPSVTAPVFRWYDTATSSTELHVGDTYTVSGLVAGRNYYVSVSGSNFCEGEANATGRRQVSVTIDPVSTASMITVSGATAICAGNTTDLTATAPGVTNPVFRWYDSATSTVILHTGASFTTQNLTATRSFFVSVLGNDYCEGAADATGRQSVTVTVSPLSTASMITASGATICTTASADLTATATGVTNPVFRWYATATAVTPFFTGATYTTGTLTSTTTYYVSVSGDNHCEGEANTTGRLAVTVTVNPLSTASMITISGTTDICDGSSTTLTASASSVTNPVFRWYATATATTAIHTGASYATPDLTENQNYYVSVSGDNYCEGEADAIGRQSVTVTVTPLSIASMITASDTTICVDTSADLRATAASVTNPVFRWYATATDATVLSTGATFTTGVLTVNTTYFVSVSGDNYCEGEANTTGRHAVTVIVNSTALASDIVISGDTIICSGTSTTLTASAGIIINPVFRWYATAIATTPFFIGATYTTSLLTADTTFYVSVSGENYCEGGIDVTTGRRVMTITVNPFSTASDITVSGTTTVCDGNYTTLTASTSSVTNPVFKWYDSTTSTTVLHTGASFETPVLSATTTYFVSVSGDNYCEGLANATGRQSATVTVTPLSTASMITASDATICTGASANITASAAGVTNPVFRWYATATALTPLFTGATFTTGLLTTTTTYYVSVSGSNYCEGLASATGRHAVTVTVNPLSTASNITISGTTTVCNGNFTTLTAAAAGVTNPVFRWYNSATSTTILYTGSSFATPALSATTTYYVSVSGDNYCEGLANAIGRQSVTVMVTPLSTSSTITISGITFVCSGDFTTLTASASGVTNPVFRWYNSATSTSVLHTGSSFATPVLSATTTYYVSVSGDNYCEGLANTTGRQSITVTMLPLSTASMITVSGTTICSGHSVILSATAGSVTNPVFRWYSTSTTLTPLFTGADFETGLLSATTTYYVSVLGDNYCEGLATTAGRRSVTVTVNPLSTSLDITISGTTVVCSGSSTTLTALASSVINPVFRWYATATSTSVLFTGASYTTGSLSVTTTYYVSVSGTNYCEGEADATGRHAVTVTIYSGVMAPLASTPQRFCGGGALSDLIVTGNNITWYGSLSGTAALPSNTPLENGTTYYASQSSDICESALRTAVTVVITSPIVLDAPLITGSQSFCGSVTLADVITDGSNIKWYDAPLGGNELPLNTPLVDGESYYAAQVAGSCESPNRTIVTVTIGVTPPAPVDIITPQSYCPGVLIANLNVPNNQVLWYADPNGGTALSPGVELLATTYYASQRTGACESPVRYAVSVTFDSLAAPDVRVLQNTCDLVNSTLADLQVSGSGIFWYATSALTDPLPLSTPLTTGATYYAVQRSATCVSRAVSVSITDECYTIRGTVFPFVHEVGDDEFNALFPVIVKLTALPAAGINLLGLALRMPTLYAASAVYYDGSIYVPGTPKHPGMIGLQNNPGERIRWLEVLGKAPGIPDNTPVSGTGDVPDAPVGLFTFTNVVPGDYLLHVTRKGYLTRFAKITVNNNIVIGHRELLAGDVNGDIIINGLDLSAVRGRISYIGLPDYTPWFDLNADGSVDYEGDMLLILSNIGANVTIYEDTNNWLLGQ